MIFLWAQGTVASACTINYPVVVDEIDPSCKPFLGHPLQSGNGGNRCNKCRDACANTTWPSPHHTSSGRRQLGEQHPWRAAEAQDQEWLARQSDHSRSTRCPAQRGAADPPLHKTKQQQQQNNTCTYHTVFPYILIACCYMIPVVRTFCPTPTPSLPATLPTPTRRRCREQAEVGFWGKRLGDFWEETWRSRRTKQFGFLLWELSWETFFKPEAENQGQGFFYGFGGTMFEQ